MAYIQDPTKKDEEKQETSMNMEKDAGQVGAKTTPGSATIGSIGAPAVKKLEKPASGLFTNIRQFLSANTGAGKQMAGQVKKSAESKASDIGQAVSEKQGQIQTAIGTANKDLAQAEKDVGSAFQDVSKLSEEQIANIRKYQEGIGQSGKGFTNVGQLDLTPEQIEARRFQKTAQTAQRPEGAFELLKQTFARPGAQYGTGMQMLDRALIKGEKADVGLAKALQDRSKALQAQIAQTQGTVAEQVMGSDPESLESRAAKLKEDIESGITTSESSIKDRLEKEAGANLGLQNYVYDLLAKGQLPQYLGEEDTANLATTLGVDENFLAPYLVDGKFDFKRYLGITPGEDIKLYGGIDPSTFIAKGAQDASLDGLTTSLLSGYATEEDVAKLQALAKLRGEAEQTFLDPSQLGATTAGIEGIDQLKKASNEQLNLVKENLYERYRTPEAEENKFNEIWNQEGGGGGFVSQDTAIKNARYVAPEVFDNIPSDWDETINTLWSKGIHRLPPNDPAYQNWVGKLPEHLQEPIMNAVRTVAEATANTDRRGMTRNRAKYELENQYAQALNQVENTAQSLFMQDVSPRPPARIPTDPTTGLPDFTQEPVVMPSGPISLRGSVPRAQDGKVFNKLMKYLKR